MMRKHKRQKIFSALLVVLLITLLIGFGISRSDVEDIIAKAGLAIEEVETYRSEMVVTHTENGETTRSSGQFEFVSPDRLRTIAVNDDRTTESIRIGQTQYDREVGSDDWEVRQWPESFPFRNLTVGIIELLDSLGSLVEMPDEEINGVDCFHYKGSIDMDAKVDEQIAQLDPSQPFYEEQIRIREQQRRWQLTYEFWVGKEDYLLRQLKQHQEGIFIKDAGEDTEREEHHSTTVTWRLFDFNQPIQIEPPVAESIE